MKKILVLLLMSLGLFAQPPQPTLTDPIYWASKNPQVASLQSLKTAEGLPNIGARESLASQLESQGLIIDRQIDIWGWDPVLVMGERASHGFLWGPNATQPNAPSLLDYLDLSKRWPNSIKYSLDAGDYPPFAPAVITPISTSPVGTYNGGVYSVNLSVAQVHGVLLYRDGQAYTDNNGTYIFHNQPGMFGPMLWWTRSLGFFLSSGQPITCPPAGPCSSTLPITNGNITLTTQ